ncbi:CBS domain-containing protein [Spirillospora sp. NPDC029432]|uniref:CBS domain-containing protein n=1 Tax=Spirillospora sp. NPDC029432 TaxID=3154599 RepID=UPI0034528F05
MRARELAVEFPVVTPDSSAMDAARLLAEHHLPGLIVVDGRRRPLAVLPASQVMGSLIPRYVKDDPNLARVYDEGHADRLCANLEGRRVADMLPDAREAPPIVDADATAMEIAQVMASARSPVVAVADDARRTDAPMIGVVTASALLGRLLAAAGH